MNSCLEEKVEIGGVRGGRERLLEEELEVFNGGTMSRDRDGSGFASNCTHLDYSRIAIFHCFVPSKG